MVGANTASQFYTQNNTQYNRQTSGFNGSLANNGFNLSALNGNSTGINNLKGFNATLMNIQKEIPLPGSTMSNYALNGSAIDSASNSATGNSTASGATNNASSNIASDVSATMSPEEMIFILYQQSNNTTLPSGSINGQPLTQPANFMSPFGSINGQPQMQAGSATNTSSSGQTDMLAAMYNNNGNSIFFEEIATNSGTNGLSTDSLQATMKKFMETALALLGSLSNTPNSSSSNSTGTSTTRTSSTGSTTGTSTTRTSSTGSTTGTSTNGSSTDTSSTGTSSTGSTTGTSTNGSSTDTSSTGTSSTGSTTGTSTNGSSIDTSSTGTSSTGSTTNISPTGTSSTSATGKNMADYWTQAASNSANTPSSYLPSSTLSSVNTTV